MGLDAQDCFGLALAWLLLNIAIRIIDMNWKRIKKCFGFIKKDGRPVAYFHLSEEAMIPSGSDTRGEVDSRGYESIGFDESQSTRRKPRINTNVGNSVNNDTMRTLDSNLSLASSKLLESEQSANTARSFTTIEELDSKDQRKANRKLESRHMRHEGDVGRVPIHGYSRSNGDRKRYRSSDGRQRADKSKTRRSSKSGRKHSRRNESMSIDD